MAMASTLMLVVGITTSNQLAQKDLSVSSIENNLIELSSIISTNPVSSSEEDRVLREFRKAEAYETKKHFDKALSCYQNVINQSYSSDYSWQACQRKAELLERQSNPEAAIAEYTSFIESTRPGILKNLAISYRLELFEKIGEADQALMDKEMLANMY